MTDNFEGTKAPEEVKDFIIDYALEAALSNPVDVIASSAWDLDDSSSDNLTIDSDTIVGTDQASCRVSVGGRLGVIHRLRNQVTMASGQVHQRTIKVTMRKL